MSNFSLSKLTGNLFGKTDKYALQQDVLDRISLINSSNEQESQNRNTGTKVIFTVNKAGIVYGFMIYGYTGYAVKGYDIVSSAISELSYHTINTIRRYTDELNESQVADGIMMFKLPNVQCGLGNDISKILISSMVKSMIDIQKDYGDYIKIYVKRDL